MLFLVVNLKIGIAKPYRICLILGSQALSRSSH